MNQHFSLKLPGQVIAGPGSIRELGSMTEGAAGVAVLTDAGVAKSGTLDLALEALRATGVSPIVIDGIPPEPEAGQVAAIYREAAASNIDLIVAVGGGSVMDTAKMVAVLLTNPGYEADLTDTERIQSPGVPVVMVPTSAGTGSEATRNSIVVLPEKKLKVGVIHPWFLPERVILDPEMTRSLPPAVTAATGLDAFCHCIETYISKKATPFSALFSLEGLRLISGGLRRAYRDGGDMQAREQLLLASFYGGAAIAHSSTVAVHALSYPLGGSYRIAHGISNAILLPHVMEYNMSAIGDKAEAIAQAMGLPVEGLSRDRITGRISEEIYHLTRELEIPDSLRTFGVPPDDLELLTDSAAGVRRLLDQNPRPMSRDDIRSIYKKLL